MEGEGMARLAGSATACKTAKDICQACMQL